MQDEQIERLARALQDLSDDEDIDRLEQIQQTIDEWHMLSSVGSHPAGGAAPGTPVMISTNNSGSVNTTKPTSEQIRKILSKNQLTLTHTESEVDINEPAYRDMIKKTMVGKLAEETFKKIKFTKRKDLQTNINHIKAQVWVFSEEDLEKVIGEILNAI